MKHGLKIGDKRGFESSCTHSLKRGWKWVELSEGHKSGNATTKGNHKHNQTLIEEKINKKINRKGLLKSKKRRLNSQKPWSQPIQGALKDVSPIVSTLKDLGKTIETWLFSAPILKPRQRNLVKKVDFQLQRQITNPAIKNEVLNINLMEEQCVHVIENTMRQNALPPVHELPCLEPEIDPVSNVGNNNHTSASHSPLPSLLVLSQKNNNNNNNNAEIKIENENR